jgi:hypothetical protein
MSDKKVVWRKPPADADIEGEVRCAEAHGHFLFIRWDERTSKWFKCIDNRYRGGVESLELAKRQLEREASGEGEAWGQK